MHFIFDRNFAIAIVMLFSAMIAITFWIGLSTQELEKIYLSEGALQLQTAEAEKFKDSRDSQR